MSGAFSSAFSNAFDGGTASSAISGTAAGRTAAVSASASGGTSPAGIQSIDNIRIESNTISTGSAGIRVDGDKTSNIIIAGNVESSLTGNEVYLANAPTGPVYLAGNTKADGSAAVVGRINTASPGPEIDDTGGYANNITIAGITASFDPLTIPIDMIIGNSPGADEIISVWGSTGGRAVLSVDRTKMTFYPTSQTAGFKFTARDIVSGKISSASVSLVAAGTALGQDTGTGGATGTTTGGTTAGGTTTTTPGGQTGTFTGGTMWNLKNADSDDDTTPSPRANPLDIVANYGAVAGSDATTAIKNALAAGVTQSKDVVIPAGTFSFTSFTVPAGVILYGADPTKSILQSTTAGNRTITLAGGATLYNLTVSASNVNSFDTGAAGDTAVSLTGDKARCSTVTVTTPQHHGILVSGSTNYIIDHCHTTDSWGDGVRIEKGATAGRIHHNLIENFHANGLAILHARADAVPSTGRTGNLRVWQNTVNTQQGSSPHITVYGADHVDLRANGCQVSYTSAAPCVIIGNASGYYASTYINFSGAHLFNSTSPLIAIRSDDSGSDTNANIRIEGGWASASGTILQVSGAKIGLVVIAGTDLNTDSASRNTVEIANNPAGPILVSGVFSSYQGNPTLLFTNTANPGPVRYTTGQTWAGNVDLWAVNNAQDAIKIPVATILAQAPGAVEIVGVYGAYNGSVAMDLDRTTVWFYPSNIFYGYCSYIARKSDNTIAAGVINVVNVATGVTRASGTPPLPGYHLTFEDDFTSMPVWQSDQARTSNMWRPVYGWGNRTLGSNKEDEWYVDPLWQGVPNDNLAWGPGPPCNLQPFSVSNSILKITTDWFPSNYLQYTVGRADAQGNAINGGTPGKQYYVYSGCLTTWQTWEQKYGYWEMRARMPRGLGMWPAFWLLQGDLAWPPETDIFEILSGHDGTTDIQTMHFTNGGMDATSVSIGDSTEFFHIYGLEWTADKFTWYVDGIPTKTTGNDTANAMYILINLAVGGDWPGHVDPPNRNPALPVSMEIDWVRAWSSDPGIGTWSGAGSVCKPGTYTGGNTPGGSTGTGGGGTIPAPNAGVGGTGQGSGTYTGTAPSTGYHCTFNEDFAGLAFWDGKTATSGVWRPALNNMAITLSGNAEDEIYVTPDYVGTATQPWNIQPFSVSNSILSITANTIPSSLAPYAIINGRQLHYTSGALSTWQTWSQLYGWFEMRALMPNGKGMWPAFWLLPADGSWPPELDIFEILGDKPTQVVMTEHFQDGTNNPLVATVSDTSQNWHTYAFEWTSSRMRWLIDGVEVKNIANMITVPMSIQINLAVGGSWPGYPDSSVTFPKVMQIDYVRAFSTDTTIAVWTGPGGQAPSGGTGGSGGGTTYTPGAAVGTGPADLSGYHVTFEDSFDHAPVFGASKSFWVPTYRDGTRYNSSNAEKQVFIDKTYTGSGSTVVGVDPFYTANSVLAITADKIPTAKASVFPAGQLYTSGILSTAGKWQQKYGYFEFKACGPSGKGLWPYFRLRPADGTFPPDLEAFREDGSSVSAYQIIAKHADGTDDGKTITGVTIGTGTAGSGTSGATRAPNQQPYNSSSVWNTPIGSGAVWSATGDADTQQLIAASGAVNSGTFSSPVFTGSSSDPVKTVTCSDTLYPISPQSIHVPVGAAPSPDTDQSMIFFDTSQPTKMWAYNGCVANSDGSGWTCRLGQVNDLCSTGEDATTGLPGYDHAVGQMRQWEIQAGKIQHTLRFALARDITKSPGADWMTNIPWPDTHEDYDGPSTYTGQVVAGSTIGIPSTVDLTTLGLSAGGLMLANALQQFGAIWRDSGGTNSVIFYAEQSAENLTAISQMRSDMSKIMPKLRILRNQGSTTKNGGGTPLVTAPAVLDGTICPLGTPSTPGITAAWHTYGVHWTPTWIRFYLDGKCQVDVANFLTSACEIEIALPVGSTALGAPDNTVTWPQTLSIDYVRAWSSDNTLPTWVDPTLALVSPNATGTAAARTAAPLAYATSNVGGGRSAIVRAAAAAITATASGAVQTQTSGGGGSGTPTAIDLTTYDLWFSDEFTGTSLDTTKWATGTDHWNTRFLSGNNELQYYADPGQGGVDAYVFDGSNLTIRAQPAPSNAGTTFSSQPYVSGAINTNQKFAFEYGYMEVRCKMPAGAGVRAGIWMLADGGGWPPEIDLFQVSGSNPRNILVQQNAGGTTDSTTNVDLDASAGFNTYSLAWDATNITWFINGKQIYQASNRTSVSMYLLFTLVVGGQAGSVSSSITWPQDWLIDYVRVYEKKTSTGGGTGGGTGNGGTGANAGTPASRPQCVGSSRLNGYNWHCTLWDDFLEHPRWCTGPKSTGLWIPRLSWNNLSLSGNAEDELYVDPSWRGVQGNAPVGCGFDPFSVSNSILSIKADRIPANWQSFSVGDGTQGTISGHQYNYWSGSMTTFGQWPNYPIWGQTYGIFEGRFKLPYGTGLWPAFWWLSGDGSWPPEIDTFEVLGNNPSRVYMTAHYDGSPQDGSFVDISDWSQNWHTIGTYWDQNVIEWWIDGQLVKSISNYINKPQFLLINLAVGGYWPGYPDGSYSFPVTMQVDWVGCWSNDPNVPAWDPASYGY